MLWWLQWNFDLDPVQGMNKYNTLNLTETFDLYNIDDNEQANIYYIHIYLMNTIKIV